MIYDLDKKEFTELLKGFIKTVYGKVMFVTCLTPFFLGLIICLVLACIPVIDFLTKIQVIIIYFVTICLLCVGCFAYYNQVRIYAEKKSIKKPE